MHWNETLSQKVTACEWGNLRIKVHGCIRIFGTFSFSQTEKSNYKTQKPEWIILAWHLQKVKQQISKIHLDVWSNDSFWCQCDYKLWRFEHNLILRLEMFQRLSIWTLKRKGVTQLLLGIEDRWRERESERTNDWNVLFIVDNKSYFNNGKGEFEYFDMHQRSNHSWWQNVIRSMGMIHKTVPKSP